MRTLKPAPLFSNGSVDPDCIVYTAVPHSGGQWMAEHVAGENHTGRSSGYGEMPEAYRHIPCLRYDLTPIEDILEWLRRGYSLDNPIEVNPKSDLPFAEWIKLAKNHGIVIENYPD